MSEKLEVIASGGPCDGVTVLVDMAHYREGDDIWLVAPDNTAPVYRLLRSARPDGGWVLQFMPGMRR